MDLRSSWVCNASWTILLRLADLGRHVEGSAQVGGCDLGKSCNWRTSERLSVVGCAAVHQGLIHKYT